MGILVSTSLPFADGTAFVVTTGDDDGPGSLRWAIADANASANGADVERIVFAIPGTAPHVIRLQSPLPPVIDPVVIDGFTQPGSAPNTRLDGFDATLAIVLDGRFAGPRAALLLRAGHSTVRGLAIQGFGGGGIRIEGGEANRLEGNLIGGDAAHANAADGVAIVDSSDNVVGGTDAAARNAITHNSGAAVSVSGTGATRNAVLGTRAAWNAGPGIALAESAANQNAPVLRNATRAVDANGVAAGTRITGSLDALPNAVYRIELFSTASSVPPPDAVAGTEATGPRMHREGDKRIFVAEARTDGGGRATLELLVTQPIDSRAALTATATDQRGSTSEFSVPIEAPASTKSWNNAAGGNWSVGTNWTPNGAPASTDDAVITLAGTYTVTLDVASSVTSLTLGGASGVQTLAIASPTLTLSGASTVGSQGVLALSGGTLTGSGDLTINGTFSWSGGTLAGTANTTVNGPFTLGGTAIKGLDGRALTTSAGTTATWTGSGNVAVGAGSVITNAGTWDCQSDASLYNPYGGAATFTNNATFKKSAGAGSTAVSIPLNNAGSVLAQSGTITFNANGTHTGTFSGNPGTINLAAGTHDLGAGASLAGTTQLSGATLNANAPVSAATFSMSAGNLGGASTFTISGLFTWTGGTMVGTGSTTPNGGVSLSGTAAKGLSGRTLITPAGTTVTWTGTGNIGVGTGSVVTNAGTWDCQSDASLYNPYGGAATFTNNATFKKSAGAGSTAVSIPLNNAGSVLAQSGTITFNANGTHTGTFSGNPGTINFAAGTHDLGAGASLAGTTQLSGATLNANAPVSAATFSMSAGNLGGASTFTISGLFTWTGGTMVGTGSTTPNGGASLSGTAGKGLSGRTLITPAGTTVTWTGTGNIGVGTGSVVTNAGTWDCQSDASLYNPYGGAATFTNNATFKKSAGTGSTAVSIPLNNASSVQAQSGTITFNANGTHTGTFSGNPGTINFAAGTHDLGAGTSLTGTTQLSGATLNANVPVTAATFSMSAGNLGGASTFTISGLFTWTGGTMVGTGSTTPNGGVSISGTAGKGLSGRTLITPAGTTVTWSGTGNIGVGTGSVVTNAGTWDCQSDASLYNPYGGAATFTNNATFKKSAGTGSTAVSIPLNNASSVQAQTGTITFNANGTHTGTFNGNPGTINFAAGTHDLGAGASLAGTTQLSGATLNANVPVTAATFSMSAGNLGGASTFTISGLFTWTGGTMVGSGSTTPNGGASLSGTAGKGLSGRTLITPAGTTVTWTGTGNIGVGTGSVITNAGTWDCQSDASLYNPYGGAATFTNNATFKKSAGAGSTAVSIPLNNASSVQAQSGTITFNANGTHTGTFSGNPGTISFAAGTHDLGAGTSLTGTTQLSGATLNANVPVTAATFSMSAGNLGGASTFTISGLFTWTGGTMVGTGSTTPNGGASLSGTAGKGLSGRTLITPAGTTVTWTGTGNIGVGTGSVVTNAGTWDCQSDASLYNPYGGTATFTNNGTLRKSAGPGSTTVSVPFTTSGTVESQSGTLAFSGGYTQSGGTTRLNGGALSSATTMNVNGGTVTGFGTATANLSSSGQVAPGLPLGTLVVSGNYLQSAAGGFNVELGGTAPGSGYDQLKLQGTGIATLAGTMNVTLVNGFVPVNGTEFTVMTYVSRTGTFSTVTQPGINCVAWNTRYDPTAVVLATVSLPMEISGQSIAPDRKTISWTPALAYPGTAYDVLRGQLGKLPVGSQPASETCLVENLVATQTTDTTTPAAGHGNWYLVRERIPGCGIGTYGYATSGAERITSTCP